MFAKQDLPFIPLEIQGYLAAIDGMKSIKWK